MSSVLQANPKKGGEVMRKCPYFTGDKKDPCKVNSPWPKSAWWICSETHAYFDWSWCPIFTETEANKIKGATK